VDRITGTASNIAEMNISITCGLLEIANKPVSPSENWSIDIPGLIDGVNSITVTAEGLNGETVSQSIILINQCEENSEGLDLDTGDDDNDCLLNWQEDVSGTAKNKADTDGDGLTDYEEVFITFTDALVIDTDGNGTGDGEEDFDSDGLNNMQECKHRTNPFIADTDNDGLSDYDEINVHFTNPLSADTDDDGMQDRLEIEYGMNPGNPDTLNDGILDGDRFFTFTKTSDDWNEGDAVKPILEIVLQGKQIESLLIEKVDENDPFLNAGIPGYIGNAYDFSVDGTFAEAVLTFEFDPGLLDDQDFVPTMVIATNKPFVATTLLTFGSSDQKEKDWWFTIGNASSAMTATVTRTGENYEMEILYYIDDFYDWEKGSPLKGGPLLTDGEMYRLHEVGLAKQFPVEGCYKATVKWTRGQRFDSGTTQPTLEEARR
jgi:hypothetical protein